MIPHVLTKDEETELRQIKRSPWDYASVGLWGLVLAILGAMLLSGCASQPQTKNPSVDPIPEKLTKGPWSVVPESLNQLSIEDAPGIKVWTFSNRMGQPCIVTFGNQPITASCGDVPPLASKDEMQEPKQ